MVTIGYPKNHASLDRCRTTVITAPSGGYTQGQMIKSEDLVGVVLTKADVGEDTTLLYNSPSITVPCEAATTGDYGVGTKVYFDETEGRVTPTESPNSLCGTVQETADLGATEVKIALDGTLHLGG